MLGCWLTEPVCALCQFRVQEGSSLFLFLAEPVGWEEGHYFYHCSLFFPYMHLAGSHQFLAAPICGTLCSWSRHRAEKFHCTCVCRRMSVEFYLQELLLVCLNCFCTHRCTSTYSRCFGDDVVSFTECSCATLRGTDKQPEGKHGRPSAL